MTNGWNLSILRLKVKIFGVLRLMFDPTETLCWVQKTIVKLKETFVYLSSAVNEIHSRL